MLRVGLLIPSSNTVMEPDFAAGLPQDVSMHTGRMFMEDTTVAGEERMLDEFTLPAAEALATARPDVVVFGCTSAGALRGNRYDQQLVARISEVTGAPAVSVIQSVRTAIREAGASRIGIITPYVDDLNQRIRASVEADGTTVVDIVGLGLDDNFAISQVSLDDIMALATQTFSGVDLDLLFASCTNFRALAARDQVEDALGVPTITSNQAALQAVHRQLEDLRARAA